MFVIHQNDIFNVFLSESYLNIKNLSFDLFDKNKKYVENNTKKLIYNFDDLLDDYAIKEFEIMLNNINNILSNCFLYIENNNFNHIFSHNDFYNFYIKNKKNRLISISEYDSDFVDLNESYLNKYTIFSISNASNFSLTLFFSRDEKKDTNKDFFIIQNPVSSFIFCQQQEKMNTKQYGVFVSKAMSKTNMFAIDINDSFSSTFKCFKNAYINYLVNICNNLDYFIPIHKNDNRDVILKVKKNKQTCNLSAISEKTEDNESQHVKVIDYKIDKNNKITNQIINNNENVVNDNENITTEKNDTIEQNNFVVRILINIFSSFKNFAISLFNLVYSSKSIIWN